MAATADGPDGYPVKANEPSTLFLTPDSPLYEEPIAEIWFRDAETAEQAGFSQWVVKNEEAPEPGWAAGVGAVWGIIVGSEEGKK